MILVLMGRSAVGKDSVVETLTDAFDFKRIISCTTRPMREGEVPGRTYHFVTPEQFEEMRGDMIDYRSYYTKGKGGVEVWQYGTKKIETYDPKKHYICILDPNGVRNYIKAYGREQLCIVEMKCIGSGVRKERAMARGSFDEAEWARREEADSIAFNPNLYGFTVDRNIYNTSGNFYDTVDRNIYNTSGNFYDIVDRNIYNTSGNFYDTVDEILTCYLKKYFALEVLKARQVLANAYCMNTALKYIDIKEESNVGQTEITIDELHDSE